MLNLLKENLNIACTFPQSEQSWGFSSVFESNEEKAVFSLIEDFNEAPNTSPLADYSIAVANQTRVGP